MGTGARGIPAGPGMGWGVPAMPMGRGMPVGGWGTAMGGRGIPPAGIPAMGALGLGDADDAAGA